MTSKEKIQQEIEKTLESLNSVKRAQANPFLFTRIKARLDKKETGWERAIFSFVIKPAVAIAIVLLVMAVNGWALWGGSGVNITADNNNGSVSELASEYNAVASATNYDYENMTNE